MGQDEPQSLLFKCPVRKHGVLYLISYRKKTYVDAVLFKPPPLLARFIRLVHLAKDQFISMAEAV